MSSQILISTTNSIQNGVVDSYFGVVSTNVVVGTNLFSDWAASFTDLFGGYSDSYQNKLQLIYDEATKQLSQKARKLGANCILGLSIDFDEISGKGKSMFMISVIGTAVKLKLNEKETNLPISNLSISSEELHREFMKRYLINQIRVDKVLPNDEQWTFILSENLDEFANDLLDCYMSLREDQEEFFSNKQKALWNNFPIYLEQLDKIRAVEIVYSLFMSNSKNSSYLIKLIQQCNLFNPKKIIEIIDKNRVENAIELLNSSKDFYDKDDLLAMKQLLERLQNLPLKGKKEKVKALFSKEEEKYICPDGHKNDSDVVYCSSFDCGLNIYGLKEKEMDMIDCYRIKVESLSALFEK